VSDFARQFTEILAGRREPVITVGDLQVSRDFTDVRDVVAAYFLLLEHGIRGEIYNICSATETSIHSILGSLSTLTGVEPEIRVDDQRKRQTQQTRVRGSYAKLERDTGWKPAIPLKQTLIDTLHYWEQQLA
jgi:GDP-4-dehydro-6-deoxy-D-mannose reductase